MIKLGIVYTKFVSSADDGDILDFNFLLSLIAGAVLVYVGVSFCIDMAVRLVKLVFYQLIAPIPIFMRVLPDTKFSGTFDSWLKVTLTCYAEVFVRVGTIYFAVYLCEQMIKSHFLTYDIWQYGFFMAIFAKAFILMGIIIFMRQLPKLLSEVTGIDSSNMKIGIKDKLKDAGVFTAGAAVGSGITALTRNAVKAKQDGKFNFRENYRAAKESGKSGFRSVLSSAKSGIQGAGSVIGGVGSGTVRGFRAGMSAGSFRDAASAAGSGAKGATDARDKRESYKALHGGRVTGVVGGHIEDMFDTGKRWAGINNIEEYQQEISSMDNINSKVDAVADEARKVLASNAKTGKKFTYGLYERDADGKIVEKIDSKTGKKVKVLRTDESVQKQYGVNIAYSLDNYRAIENAIQRAESSGGSVSVRVNEDGTLEYVADPTAVGKDGKPLYGKDEVKTFSVDDLSRIQNMFVTNYSEAVANQAFKSKDHYEAIIDGMEDYKEQAAMSAIRAKAEEARNELARSLNSEAVIRANKASQEHYYREILAEYKKKGLSAEDAAIKAKEDLEKMLSDLLLNASTIDGDLRITDRTALNYYGAAAKEVKSDYLTEISKIEQKEKDKNGK